VDWQAKHVPRQPEARHAESVIAAKP